MKKSELKNIIREELLKEYHDYTFSKGDSFDIVQPKKGVVSIKINDIFYDLRRKDCWVRTTVGDFLSNDFYKEILQYLKDK